MDRVIPAAIVAFVLAVFAGPAVIPMLRELKFGQTIYELGPKTHQKKQGTPTMGGVIFAVPALIASAIFAKEWKLMPILLVSMLGFALIGFTDDWIKVKMKRSLGLTVRQKLIPQILLSVVLGFWVWKCVGGRMHVPFCSKVIDLKAFSIPLLAFVFVAVVNSANLLDGMDGLLGGCAAIDLGTLCIMCGSLSFAGGKAPTVFSGALVGALIGFLLYNTNPAKVFMGDVGSFFLGGAIAGIAAVSGLVLYLPVIALAMVASSVSDIVQIMYANSHKGRRLMKMTPIHYHFELSGMPETRVTAMYRLLTLMLCLIALIPFVH